MNLGFVRNLLRPRSCQCVTLKVDDTEEEEKVSNKDLNYNNSIFTECLKSHTTNLKRLYGFTYSDSSKSKSNNTMSTVLSHIINALQLIAFLDV